MSSESWEESDTKIVNWLNESQAINEKPWAESRINGIIEGENPFYDENAEKASKKSHSRMVSIMSCKSYQFDSKDVKVLPDQYPSTKKSVFRTEFAESTESTTPDQNFKVDATSAYSISQTDSYKNLEVPSNDISALSNEKFLKVTLNPPKIEFKVVEPLTYSTFIFDNGKIITQQWETFDAPFKCYFEENPTTSASFNLRSISDKAYLVTVVNRCFQVDNGDVCSSHMKKPTDSSHEKARKALSATYPHLKGFWTPFALTFIRVSDITAAKVSMPPLRLTDNPGKMMTEEMISKLIEKAEKLDKIKYTINYLTERIELPKVSDSLDSLTLPPLFPASQYTHRLIVTVKSAKFDLPKGVSAKSIGAEVTFVQGDECLPAVHGRWTGPAPTTGAFTRVLYNEKSPVFEDTFTIELPLNSQGLVVLKFYKLEANKKEKSKTFFGTAALDITEDGLFIKDGPHKLGIAYEKTVQPVAPRDGNYIVVSTKLQSTVTTNIKQLAPVFGIKGSFSLKDVKPCVIMNNLFGILDLLLEQLPKNPDPVFTSLIGLDNLVSVVEPKELEKHLLNYASLLAFRPGMKHEGRHHHLILQEWASTLIKYSKVVGSERKDVHMASFLFALVLKSIVVSDDKDIAEPIQNFVQAWTRSMKDLASHGVNQANEMQTAFARFVVRLADIGRYQAAVTCIEGFAAGLNSPSENRVLVGFLEHALSPKHFIGLSVNDDRFVQVIVGLCQRVSAKETTDPIHRVYEVIARVLSFVPDDVRATIASRYIGIVGTFGAQIKGKPEEIITHLAVASFILRYAEEGDVKKMLEEFPYFIEFMHFFLVKTKYVPGGIATTARPDLSALENMFQSKAPQAPGSGLRSFRRNKMSTLTGSFNAIPTLAQQDKAAPKKNDFEFNRDIAIDAQLAAINVSKRLLENEKLDSCLDIVYHLLSMNLCIDAARPLVDVLLGFVNGHVKYLIECREPPLVLILKKVLGLMAQPCKYVVNTFAELIPALLAKELEVFQTNNRVIGQAVHALSLIEEKYLISTHLKEALENTPLAKEITQLSEIYTEMKKTDSELYQNMIAEKKSFMASKLCDLEYFGDLLWRRVKIFERSPDASLAAMRDLDRFHNANDYGIEAFMVKLVECALVSEYLVASKRMPCVWPQRPADAIATMCPAAAEFAVPDDIANDLPAVPGFCTSALFNESGVVIIMQETLSILKENRIFEIMNELTRLFIPLFERYGMAQQLADMFKLSEDYYKQMSMMTEKEERLLGKYYRVAFYGKMFGDDDGKTYIYREPKLTGLFVFQQRLEDIFTRINGPGSIERITKAGAVDRRQLDENKGYLQITYVTPTFEKSESDVRVTSFECNTRLRSFQFEVPFVKGSNKAQGDVATQCLRRTIFTTSCIMPTVVKRIEVKPEDIKNIEFEPIKVSNHQLKERLATFRAAIASRNMMQIQPLITGTLMAAVNDGPMKFAEVFLKDKLRTKQTEKMRGYYRVMEGLLAELLELHREFSKGNPAFENIQVTADQGYVKFKEDLKQYI